MYILTKVYLDEEYLNELVDMMIHREKGFQIDTLAHQK